MSKISARKYSITSESQKKTSLLFSIWRNRQLLVLLLSTLTFYIVFSYGPMYGIIIAFKNFNVRDGILGSPWAGMIHFKRLFGDPEFFKIIRNTLLINLYQLIFAFPAPIVFALMLNEIGSRRYRRFIQTATYLPHFISWVVMAGLLIYFLSPSYGIVNYVLKGLTGKSIYFMSKKEYFRSIIVISGIWKEIGWNSIIYMAAIAAIDQSQYEAAICDGANRFRRIWHITLPSILPTISVLMILNLGSFLGSNFDQIFNLLNPVLFETGDVFDTFVYRVGLTQFQYSYTTAIGLFRSLVGMILIITANFLANKLSDGEVGMW